MTDRLARALRALADRLSPPRPRAINVYVDVDRRIIARAVEDAARKQAACR